MLIKSLKILFIMVWKVASEFVNPKNIIISSNDPFGIMNAVFYLFSSFIYMLRIGNNYFLLSICSSTYSSVPYASCYPSFLQRILVLSGMTWRVWCTLCIAMLYTIWHLHPFHSLLVQIILYSNYLSTQGLNPSFLINLMEFQTTILVVSNNSEYV